MKDLIDLISRLTKRDMIRGGALILVLAYMYFSDATGFSVVTYMISLMLVIALFSHFIRRIIFPYLDMGVIAKAAKESPTGAAVVFASICFIIGCLIISVGGMLG